MSKNPFRSLKRFEIYTISAAVSKMGNELFSIVIPLYIYKLTNSSVQMGISWFLQLTPYIATPLIGKMVDKFNKRTLFIGSEIMQGILVGLIPLLSFYVDQTKDLVFIYACVLLINTCSILSELISDYSFITNLARSDNYVIWNSTYITFTTAGKICGPLVAGLAIGQFGYLPTLYIDSISFLFTALFAFTSLKQLDHAQLRRSTTQITLSIADGFRKLLEIPRLLQFSIGYMLLNFAFAGLPIVYIFTMKHQWSFSDKEVGYILSCVSVSGMIGSLFVTRLFKSLDEVKKIRILALILWCVSILMLFSVYASITGFIAIECIAIAMLVHFMSFRQKMIPAVYIGRVNAIIRLILLGLSPFSALLLSYMANSDSRLCFYIIVLFMTAGVFIIWVGRKNEGKQSSVHVDIRGG